MKRQITWEVAKNVVAQGIQIFGRGLFKAGKFVREELFTFLSCCGIVSCFFSSSPNGVAHVNSANLFMASNFSSLVVLAAGLYPSTIVALRRWGGTGISI
jgi:hypothetical protein